MTKADKAEAEQPVMSSGALQRMLQEWRIWYLALIWAITAIGIDTLSFWLPLLVKYGFLLLAASYSFQQNRRYIEAIALPERSLRAICHIMLRAYSRLQARPSIVCLRLDLCSGDIDVLYIIYIQQA